MILLDSPRLEFQCLTFNFLQNVKKGVLLSKFYENCYFPESVSYCAMTSALNEAANSFRTLIISIT
jgi:hypothetical protein